MAGFALTRLFPQGTLAFAPPTARNTWPVLNLEDPAWLKALFVAKAPELLIYCHAVCNVRKCEAEPGWARQINVHHIERLLECLPDTTRLVYVSSDHVFGGDGSYDEDTPPCPISVYGRTRVEAEALILARDRSLVLRPGLAIGASHNGRSGHCDWLAYRHQQGLPITIVTDEFRSAMWVDDLAVRIMDLAQSEQTGLRHIAATQTVGRLQLAQYLTRRLGINPVLHTASRHGQPAPHLGRVELVSVFRGPLHEPLPSVMPSLAGR